LKNNKLNNALKIQTEVSNEINIHAEQIQVTRREMNVKLPMLYADLERLERFFEGLHLNLTTLLL
jgi:hypothetical protein